MSTSLGVEKGEPAARRLPRALRAGTRSTLRQSGVAWVLLAPFLLVFFVFTVVPAIGALAMSFTDVGSSDVRNLLGVNIVGLDTFGHVLADPTFQRAVVNTAVFVVIGVPVTMAIAFVLALILNSALLRLKTFFRGAIFLPVVTNVVAAAVIWQYAFTLGGPVNSGLGVLHIHGPNWLGDPVFAVPTVVSLGIWRNIGTCMVLFLAGLQGIPAQVYEASSLDGARFLRQLTSMTLPLLRPTTLLVSVLMTVSFLNIFDEPYLVTNGGPLGSTESLALWVYRQFGFGNIAASMAGSFLLLLLVAVVALVQFRMLRSKE